MDSVSGITEQYALPKTTVHHTKELGKEEFLKVMIAQLQNQDPTAPLENTEMISQMAQFNVMESMSSMSLAMTQSQSYSMIGKGVTGISRNDLTGAITDVIGTVDSAGVQSGKPYIMVGDQLVWMSDIGQVFDKNIISGQSEGIMAATSMVGKYIRANVGSQAYPSYTEGKAERMTVEDGVVFVTAGGQNIPLNQIIAVSDTASGLGDRPEESALG